MVRQFALVPAILIVIFALAGTPVTAESKEEGINLYEEGQILYKNAAQKRILLGQSKNTSRH